MTIINRIFQAKYYKRDFDRQYYHTYQQGRTRGPRDQNTDRRADL